MSCDRAGQIEIGAFLIDPEADGQAEFRAHYPECPDCSAAVAQWTALDLAVRSGPVDSAGPMREHPSLESLERLIDAASSPGAEEIMTRDHVDACPQCQTEFRMMQQFDPTALSAAAVGTSPLGSADLAVGASEAEGLFDSIRGFFESLSEGLGFSPAALGGFAVALVAVFGIWLSGALDGFGSGAGSNAPDSRFAEGTPPPNGGPGSASGLLEPDGDPGSTQRREWARVEDEAAPGRAEAPDDAEPQLMAQAPAGDAASGSSDSEPSATPASEGEREEILLAALGDLPLPTYGAPPGVESMGWMRQFGAVRGRADAKVVSRAPDHVGLTLSSAPTLWWHLDAATDLTVQITVVDEEAIDPIVRVDLPGPHAAGLHSISLAEYSVELAPDLEYRWFVTLLVDADRPSRNPVSGGAIQVVPDGDDRRGEAAASERAERGHVLAKLGFWYDAYDFFAAISVAHPDADSVKRHRNHMMEVAGANP